MSNEGNDKGKSSTVNPMTSVKTTPIPVKQERGENASSERRYK